MVTLSYWCLIVCVLLMGLASVLTLFPLVTFIGSGMLVFVRWAVSRSSVLYTSTKYFYCAFNLQIWEVYNDRRLLRTYSGHSKAVRDISFNNDGTRFLTASYDRHVKLFDTETGASHFKHLVSLCTLVVIVVCCLLLKLPYLVFVMCATCRVSDLVLPLCFVSFFFFIFSRAMY